MKATGIVRRIDDLGRLVIPKEIRKTMNIKEGDALELFTDKGKIIFQKYNDIDWEYIGNILNNSFLADVPFALYDSDFNATYRTSDIFKEDGSIIEADFIRTIDDYGYIAFCSDDYELSTEIVNLIISIIENS